MEQFLDQAETLLRDVVRSCDISTLVVLHRLRDLTKVLDKLKLYEECRLAGNCALDLAEALCRRSPEFRHEQTETLALFAGLFVYQPRARTLFTQAVSICEEVVENDASDSNKMRLLIVLERAGFWAIEQPKLGAQWLEYAVRLMTKELPPTMMAALFCGGVYNSYGSCLLQLREFANAALVYHRAISIRRKLASENPVKYNYYLAGTLTNMGISLNSLGEHAAAATAHKEALELCRTGSAQNPLQYKPLLARILSRLGSTFLDLSQNSKSAEMWNEAVSLFRDLSHTEIECIEWLCDALNNYGHVCHLLEQHAEAVLAYQECISLCHAQVIAHPKWNVYLIFALHDMANCLHALGQEAEPSANQVLQMNQGKVLKKCRYAPDFSLCFVCQRVGAPCPMAMSVSQKPRPMDFSVLQNRRMAGFWGL
jgi:tetratricopeptide (TPR) repeat protein